MFFLFTLETVTGLDWQKRQRKKDKKRISLTYWFFYLDQVFYNPSTLQIAVKTVDTVCNAVCFVQYSPWPELYIAFTDFFTFCKAVLSWSSAWKRKTKKEKDIEKLVKFKNKNLLITITTFVLPTTTAAANWYMYEQRSISAAGGARTWVVVFGMNAQSFHKAQGGVRRIKWSLVSYHPKPRTGQKTQDT